MSVWSLTVSVSLSCVLTPGKLETEILPLYESDFVQARTARFGGSFYVSACQIVLSYFR